MQGIGHDSPKYGNNDIPDYHRCTISHELLDKALRYVADKSFNRVSIDGDTSVCDQLVIMANGQGGNTPIVSEDSDYEIFVSALLEFRKVSQKCSPGTEKAPQS